MKETEIRIGNYFYHKNFGNYQFKKSHFGIRLNFSEPIPLTEERLLELEVYKDKTGYYVFPQSAIRMTDDFRVFDNIDYGGVIYIGEKLKYVHQLQNLYFALTGYELEIKN